MFPEMSDKQVSQENAWKFSVSGRRLEGCLAVYNFLLFFDLYLKGNLYLKQEKDTSTHRISLPYMSPCH